MSLELLSVGLEWPLICRCCCCVQFQFAKVSLWCFRKVSSVHSLGINSPSLLSIYLRSQNSWTSVLIGVEFLAVALWSLWNNQSICLCNTWFLEMTRESVFRQHPYIVDRIYYNEGCSYALWPYKTAQASSSQSTVQSIWSPLRWSTYTQTFDWCLFHDKKCGVTHASIDLLRFVRRWYGGWRSL